jgi:hypothetical protein
MLFVSFCARVSDGTTIRRLSAVILELLLERNSGVDVGSVSTSVLGWRVQL